MPKLRHIDNLGTARFITFSCYHRYPLLVIDEAKIIFLKHLQIQCKKHYIKILGYVLMPEHVHLVLYPPDDLELGKVIGQIKALSSKEILEKWRDNYPVKLLEYNYINKKAVLQSFWQKRCYDHNCRNQKTTIEKINYCHKNPVVRKLVKDLANWKWSGYNWYVDNRKDIPLEIDSLDSEN